MQAATHGIYRPARAQQMAEGGFVKAIKSVVDKLTTQTPKDAPLGSGAANQAKEALTTRKQVLDDAEKKAVGMAKGGAVRHDMAKGGQIPGKSPTPTADNIKVDATAGEFMIKKSAADVLGPKVLKALNAVGDNQGDAPTPAKGKDHGAVRKMADGGYPEDKAAFGLFPQLAGGKRTTYATDNALRSGVEATGPGTFRPALTPSAPAIMANGPGTRMDAKQDPRSMIAAPITQPVATVKPTSTVPAVPAPTGPAAGAIPLSPQALATSIANPTNPAGAVTRIGNSYSGAPGVSGDISVNGKAPTSGGFVSGTGDGSFRYGGSGGGGGGAIQTGTWGDGTPMYQRAGGFGAVPTADALHGARLEAAQRGDFDAVKASYAAQGQNFGPKVDPIDALLNNGRPMTTRKAAALGALQKAKADQQAVEEQRKLERDKFGLDKTTSELGAKTMARLNAAEEAVLSAKTPEARDMAVKNLEALQKRSQRDLPPEEYAAIAGGIDAMGNRTDPLIYSKRTGKRVDQGGAALPPGLVVGASTKQADGTYQAGGRTVVIKGGKVTEIK